jgi:diaminohydroxyphosphoribosylaminopyrimidine deaminase/5-amino-6-(5-phosphoribosylamino)uracil reductase
VTTLPASPSFSAADHRHMARALALAARGLWTTSPNPRVGCVIVAGDMVIGEGWHRRAGEPHAEVNALQDARARAPERIAGATAYVTLEPCAHTGRTPPCCEALVAARVGRVVAAMEDPNPLVAGRGLAAVRAAGIVAEIGLCAGEAADLNAGFVSRMTHGRPWVRVKLAATIDGRTALAGGESQWITGPAAREDGHRFRARACAILTGSGTVAIDNPQLTARLPGVERQPQRIVIDGALRISPQARVLAGGGTLLATASDDAAAAAALRATGVELLHLPGPDGRVDLAGLLGELARRGINELHVEAGPRLAGALMTRGLVDELLLYLAPSLIGDTGRGLIALPALESLSDRVSLRWQDIRQVGDALRVIARVV